MHLPVDQLKSTIKELDLGETKVYHLPNWDNMSHPDRLGVIRKIAEMRGRDPRISKLAVSIVKRAGAKPREYEKQAAAILRWVQNPANCYYANEPGERLQDPIYTLEAGHGDCLPENTLLLRDDHKMIPISQIEPGQRIWGKDRWSQVIDVWEKGRLEVDRIELTNGSSFDATPGHKVYVLGCEKHGAVCPKNSHKGPGNTKIEAYVRIPVSELREGMIMLVPEHVSYGQHEMEPDRAYIEGLYLSDGWVDGNTARDGEQHVCRFAISGQDGCPKEKQKRDVQAICERLGISTRWHRKYLAVNDRAWAERLEACGRHAYTKEALSISLTQESADALLRGILADSGLSRSGTRVFTSTSRALALQVRMLVRMQGYTCGEEYIPDHGGLGKHPIWRMNIRKTKQGEPKFYPTRVKSISRGVGRQECYDISTDDHYVYLPEADVTVSNCDDSAALICSLFESIRLPWRLVLSGKDANGQKVRYIEGTKVPPDVRWAHIYAMVGAPPYTPNVWWFCEPTVVGVPLGWDVVSGDASYLPEMNSYSGPVRVLTAPPMAWWAKLWKPSLPPPQRRSPAYSFVNPEYGAMDALGPIVGAAIAESDDEGLNLKKTLITMAVGVISGVTISVITSVLVPKVKKYFEVEEG